MYICPVCGKEFRVGTPPGDAQKHLVIDHPEFRGELVYEAEGPIMKSS
ncbi:MAG TPA: hypothetical protein VFF13_07055 [archaeon]|nr:hypothetical protein [archaeon]